MSDYQFRLDSDGRLYAEGLQVCALAATYGTPLNIISGTQLTDNLRRFKRAFADGWQGPVRVLPAIKSNTSMALCRMLARETDGCDLFSEGEMEAALRSGFRPECLSLNGNNKLTADMAFLEYAIRRGVRITIDDKSEFEPIESIAKRLGVRVKVRLRVRPNFSNLNRPSEFVHEGPLASEFANMIYKAAIPSEDLIPLGRRVIASDHFDLTGLHLHLGRHRKELDFWKAVLKGYAGMVRQLKEAWDGWQPGEIDIGGGFAQHLDPFKSYSEGKAMRRELALLNGLNRAAGLFGDAARYRVVSALLAMGRGKVLAQKGPDLIKGNAPSIEEYGRVARVFRDELRGAGVDADKILLEIEPGRGLFGSAAVHAARVSFVKRQTGPVPWKWVITDTTEYWLLGANNPPNQPYIVDGKPLDRYPVGDRMVADIAGKSCGPDRIVGDACLPGDIGPGDLIVWIGTGAYQEMQSSNFNYMGRPATVLVKGDREGLIRRRETMEDVFDREHVPDWLE